MEPYIIALDMDGTLLNEKGEITEKTATYLCELEKRGHLVVISSGRPIRAIEKYYRQIGLHSPIICYNGAYITNPQDPSFPEKVFSFPKEIVHQICQDIGNDNIQNIMCETNNEIWLVQQDAVLSQFFWHDGMEVHYGDIRQTLNQDPMTMIIEAKSKEADPIIIEAVEKYPHLKVRFWNGFYSLFSEIYFDYVSKADGLKYIADFYHIPHDHIIAMGDACNDIEMLSLAGHAVAMKNGDDAIKKYAHRISEYDHNHDGVYHELYQIFH